MPKIIFIIGGTSSGIGKGVLASSIAVLLKDSKKKVSIAKFNGLLNDGFELMYRLRRKPVIQIEGEEIFVSLDGKAVDTDIGMYERFLGVDVPSNNCMFGGKILKELIDSPATPEYEDGKALQLIHAGKFFWKNVEKLSKGKDYLVVEVGGTLGDPETEYVLREISIRKLKEKNTFVFLLTTAPIAGRDRERTKFVRRDIDSLIKHGIVPDLVFIRCDRELSEKTKNILKDWYPIDKMVVDLTVDDIYMLPKYLKKYIPLFERVLGDKLNVSGSRHKVLYKTAEKITRSKKVVRIAVSEDDYGYGSSISFERSLKIIGAKHGIKVELVYGYNDDVDAIVLRGELKKNMMKKLFDLSMRKDLPLLGIGYTPLSLIADVAVMNNPYSGKIRLKGFLKNIYKNNEISVRFRRFNYLIEKSKDFIVDGFILGKPTALKIKNGDYPKIFIGYNPEYNTKPGRPEPIVEFFIKEAYGTYGKRAAYIMLKHKNKVLLIKRSEKQVIWEFPGGKIEIGEQPKQAAIRELREETGVIVKDAKFVGRSRVVYDNGDTRHNWLYIAELKKEPEIKLNPREHSSYKWIDIKELFKQKNLALSVKSFRNIMSRL